MNWPKKLSAGFIALMMTVPSNAIGVLAQETEEPVPEEETVEVVEEATIEEEAPVEISEEETVVEEEEIAEEPAEEISEEEITEEVPEETVETVEEAPAEDEEEIVEEVVEETEVEEVAEGENDLESQKTAFLETLEKDGYAEFGAYHVEKIKDGVYHMDEELKSCPGGANLPDYVDIDTGETKTGVMNNPSSMYFVVTDNEVVMIDGGDVLRSQEKFDSAKAIIEAMTGEKPLTFIITHGHSDHVRMVTTEGVLDNVNVKAVYIGKDDYMADENKVVGSTTATPLPLTIDKEKVHTVKEGDVITVDGLKYDIIDIPAHTPGSLAIVQQDKAVVFTGDSIGSGFVWAFWMYGDNPLGALQDGVKKLQDVVKNMTGASILAGHRWQQFYDFGDGSQPKEMGIQYLNDLSAVISGLANGTTMRSPYTLRGNEEDIELTAVGSKAKVDTQQPCIDAYLKALVQIDEAYVYSGADKLSIETENNVAAPTFVIYPDKALTDEEAQKLLDDSGLTAVLNRTASKAFVVRPIGDEYAEADVQRFKDIVQKQVAVCENFKLIGIGSGATFINKYLTPYMNFVAGLALIGGEAGETPKASVPTYISGSAADPAAYIAANKAVETGEGTYANPDSRFEIVVVNKADEDAAAGIKNAWDKVLNKFGRIGNLIDNSDGNRDTIGTWYSRPLISGNDAADQARVYQYFDSLDAITGLKREVVTEDLDGDGQLNLWYEYIPAQAENAEKGTVPAILLMHGNTNDPRTQVDTAAWANIAVDEGVILIAPEWQGHVYQGYSYQPMIYDINNPTGDGYDDSAFIKMIEMIEEKYPQLDPTRVYISGLSAGSRNTLVQGLKNGKYIAAGAGHSGAWGVTGGAENADVVANKDAYDFPIIFFAGDADEYMKAHYDTVDATAGPITTIQAYQGLNNMEPLKAEDLDAKYIAESGYPVPFDETYTIDANAENVATIKGGVLTSDKNVEISLNRIYGWGHWNYAPATKMMWDFMKKYARDPETGASIRLDMDEKEAGVKVDGNNVSFTYIDEDEKDAVKVTFTGNFQWFKWDEVGDFQAMGDNSGIPCYDADHYEEGMFNASGGLNNDTAVYELEETSDEVFEFSFKLPGNLYFYDYTVEYADGTKVTMKDPANMPKTNPETGSDAGHSLFYVGDAKNTTKGQEYIYERTDEKKGTYQFVPYTAIDGTEQYIGVYLPYGYDESKTYKTVYISHGGGGNEEEWMSIGAVPNILDNLIADGKVEPTIAVTMNNTYFNWDYEKVLPNVVDYIIPCVEENFAVSTEANDRAFCGLSMGSMTTNEMAKTYPNEFGYFGSFSGGSQDLDKTHYDVEALNNSVLYLTAGAVDMAYNNKLGIASVDYMKMYDELGVNYTFDLLGGAHDWGVWRESFTIFAKDYLWTPQPVEAEFAGIVTDAGEYVDYMTVDFGDAEVSGIDNDTFKVLMTSTVDYGQAKGKPYAYYDATKPLKVVKTEVEGGLVKVYFQQDQAPVLTWLAEGRNYPAILKFTITQEKPIKVTVEGEEKVYDGRYFSTAASWKDLENEELAKFEDVQDEINYQFHKGTNDKLIVFFHGNGEGDFPVKDTNNNVAQILANRGGVGWVSEEAQEVFGDASVMAFQAPNM
ncbi:MAG: MBL fold metallo-hydrolase, partial [Solobacterium sp.]|nr:MBL fold metallo-hydrolase [Solobacterium sp.]